MLNYIKVNKMIDLNNYFKLNIINYNNKLFQVFMNKAGNIMALEQKDNEYLAPEISDLIAIKDEIYNNPDTYCLNESINEMPNQKQPRKKLSLAKIFVGYALVLGLVIPITIRATTDGIHLFNSNGESLSISQMVDINFSEPLTTLSEVREVFNESITKEDVLAIVKNKNWREFDKELMISFINLLPEDQDLFILKENILAMEINAFSSDTWSENNKTHANADGTFCTDTSEIRYIVFPDDPQRTEKTFFHEAVHATTLLKKVIEGKNILITSSQYTSSFLELATTLYQESLRKGIDTLTKDANQVNSYQDYMVHMVGYIYYYGAEVIVDYLRAGDIEGFILAAEKDFPDIREHIALLSTASAENKDLSEERFVRLYELSAKTLAKGQIALLERNGYNNYFEDSRQVQKDFSLLSLYMHYEVLIRNQDSNFLIGSVDIEKMQGEALSGYWQNGYSMLYNKIQYLEANNAVCLKGIGGCFLNNIDEYDVLISSAGDNKTIHIVCNKEVNKASTLDYISGLYIPTNIAGDKYSLRTFVETYNNEQGDIDLYEVLSAHGYTK